MQLACTTSTLLKVIIIIGVVILVYSFIGDAHLELYWPDIVQPFVSNPNVALPKTAGNLDTVLMSLKRDWLVIRYIGIFISIIGVVGLIVVKLRGQPKRLA